MGQIFTIRVAGEVPDSSTIASIEYALEKLGPRLLVVLGHESCGAVQAALDTPAGQSVGSPDLDKMVEAIRPHVSEFSQTSPHDPKFRQASKANVKE